MNEVNEVSATNEAWQIASTIWALPVEQLVDIFDCDIADIFTHYSPSQAKKILHDAGILL